MNRRNFLKTVSKTAAGIMLSGSISQAGNNNLSTDNNSSNGSYSKEFEDLEKYDFILPRVKFTPIKIPGRGQGPDFWNVRVADKHPAKTPGENVPR